jgi:exodeoxyribonuclease VII large subunit
VERRLGRWSARLERAEVRPAWLRSTVAARRSESERATARLRASVERGLERRRGRLDAADASLRALSPPAVVERGYALVWRDRDHELVRSVQAVAPREGIHVSVADGEIAARVTATRSETRDDD